jgi:hypothetical protein
MGFILLTGGWKGGLWCTSGPTSGDSGPGALWDLTKKRTDLVKGQCHEIFCFRFFFMNHLPPAPKNNIRIISNFFQKFAKIFANSRHTPGINDTNDKFTTGVNDAGGK